MNNSFSSENSGKNKNGNIMIQRYQVNFQGKGGKSCHRYFFVQDISHPVKVTGLVYSKPLNFHTYPSCHCILRFLVFKCSLLPPPTSSLSSKIPRTHSRSEVAQLCPTLCDLMDCSLPGSSVHGIFQARILEWVVISFSTF